VGTGIKASKLPQTTQSAKKWTAAISSLSAD